MAEAIGLAASAIWIAGAAQNLYGLSERAIRRTETRAFVGLRRGPDCAPLISRYIFIASIRKAEKQPNPIANHVKLTSIVLENVGNLLKKNEIRDL